MIVYFADRKLNILGQATTGLPGGLVISNDRKTGDVETGVDVFECKIHFDEETRLQVEEWAEVGNYILRKSGNDTEFYTIIDSECNTKKQTMYIYVEDAGLDLLNEVVGEYEADKAYSIAHYIETFAYDSGFRIGINEVANLTRKLSWDGEQTVTARLASVATQFDGCEIAYSFDISGLRIKNKFINIYKKRCSDDGVTLWLNKDIDNIITTKSIANIATALRATGGTPENAEDPITLRGYKYDDGDFYIDGDCLKSRNGLKRWSRYLNPNEPNQKPGHEGHIVRLYSYDTPNQATLLQHTLTELKKLLEVEVNYEVDIMKLPDNVRVGDRINIVDEAGELYLSTRILQLEVSEADQTQKATLGEHLIKASGIHQKVIDLAAQFAKTAQSAARALANANKATEAAETAQNQANNALDGAEKAQQAATEAATAANTAQQSADNAQAKADNAQSAVENVQEKVTGLEATVDNAQKAAASAQQAADTAQSKADEAAQNAANALANAAEANAAVEVAQGKAEQAITKADEAKEAAETAKAEATTAKATADAAKVDAENAEKAIGELGEQLETVTTTMEADYARKTDLTEATANLQTQVSQNAAEIQSTATKVQTIDETANNAKEQAEAAQSTADQAQETANQAVANASAAQTAADEAATAAANAQSEADAAKSAAATAQSVADKAEADLEAAKADLATVTSRVGATEEEIASAQQAVEAAQAAADKAKQDADTATEKATTAQQTADTAVSNASAAQQAANEAASKADAAQALANQAKGDAAAAQSKADEAAQAAANAQATADTAAANATNAQTIADQAAADAATAKKAADDADAKADQAAADLAAAEQNLADVTSRVGATEEEVAAAQAAVTTAQNAADQAKTEAEAAQAAADKAKQDAANAQNVADNAKTAADNAQAAADAAQTAADEAQAAVDALSIRVTKTETDIIQTSEQIALLATKEEVSQTLGGYYTKEETNSAISAKADEIELSVDTKIEALDVGGRNLLLKTEFLRVEDYSTHNNVGTIEKTDDGIKFSGETTRASGFVFPLAFDGCLDNGVEYTLSMEYRTNISGAYPLYVLQNTSPNVVVAYPRYEASETDWVKLKVTFSHDEINDGVCRALLFPYVVITPETPWYWLEIKSKTLKLERGIIATDWTPAPEDTDSAIEETAQNLQSQITEQRSSVLVDSEQITLSKLEEYVKNTDFADYKKTVETDFSVLDGEISMKFETTSGRIDGVDQGLQDEVETRSKHISYTENGITIISTELGLKLRLDTSGIGFYKGAIDENDLTKNRFGYWDGTNFHTGNIVIDVNERAQFGPIAFVPRSDGSVALKKVK
jgi:phage minor structural protein